MAHVRRMLSNPAQVSSQLLFRSLRAAAQSGNADLMEFLISRGAAVNRASDNPNDKQTVLRLCTAAEARSKKLSVIALVSVPRTTTEILRCRVS
jgi:hypothetical protein